MTTGTALGPDTMVSRWVGAFNARDLEGMLGCLSEDVDFHPLRMGGCDGWYSGHDGVSAWWDRLTRGRLEYQIAISQTRHVDDGRVLASGAVTLADGSNVGSFCALHTVEGDLIVAAHHYLSDPEMIEQLGFLR
jgi:hypothetical protein